MTDTLFPSGIRELAHDNHAPSTIPTAELDAFLDLIAEIVVRQLMTETAHQEHPDRNPPTQCDHPVEEAA
jgi:hypothetical protein